MTLWLAVDTALAYCQAAVALVEPSSVRLSATSGAPAEGDAEAIVEHAATALAAAAAAPSDLEAVAVTVGPGSFTGVRVGIAYAKGLAFALRVPAVGVSTLAVLARQAGGPGPVLAVIDARHDAVFAELFGVGEARPAARIPTAEARAMAEAAGAQIIGPPTAIAAIGAGQTAERLDLVALIAVAREAPRGRGPKPLYLAAVDAKPQHHKALARARALWPTEAMKS